MTTANSALQPRRRTKKEQVAESQRVDSAVAEMRNSTVKMKRVMGKTGVAGGALGEQARAVEFAVLQGLEPTDHTHGRGIGAARHTVPLEIEKQAILDVAAGTSPRHVEVEYDLHQNYVAHALKRRFGSPEAAKLALQGFVLENALACQVVAAQQIEHMSGPQAVMSGAILIDKAIALEKSIADQPKTINFAALADMGKTLKVLREIVTEQD